VLASFLLPTRGRPSRLLASVHSLWERASQPTRFEVMLRVDDDDVATIEAAKNLQAAYPQVQLFVGPRGRGYLDLHLMCNDLAAASSGEFIVLWNDDATMETRGWDDVLEEHLFDPPRVYHPSSPGTSRNIFPIVRRSIYQAMGRFSESALNDFYVWTLAKRLNINTSIALNVIHDHPQVGGTQLDQTYLDAVQACGVCKNDDKDPRILACLAEDEAKVAALLGQ
jgi:hypothetical protein